MTEVPSDRLIRTRIFLGAIKSRRAAAAVLFTVAVLAIAAAAIGPMFMQSADTSVLTSTASAAIPGQSDITVISNGGAAQLSKLATAVRASDRLSNGLLSRTIYSVDVGSFFNVKGQGFGADVFARTDICEHLKILHGACPTQLNDVAMSERSAVAAHLHVGSHVRIGAAHSTTTIDLTITAIYQPPTTVVNNYWKDNYYFVFGTGTGPTAQLDPFVASFATVLATTTMARPQLEADLAWRPGATLSGAAVLESTASKIRSLLFSHYDLASSSGLGVVIAAAHHDDDLMSAVVLALVLQLILLSLLILYTLGRSTILGRRQESDFARRHGFPRGTLIALAIGEPGALIVAALPVGVLVAWLTLLALTKTVFVRGTPVSLSVLAIVCAAGACLAGVVAMAVASSELWRSRSINSRQVRIVALAVDAFALALALTGLISLATKGSLNGVQANPLASLAPGLLALGAGVIGLRLTALAIGAIIRRTGESNRVALFLALRQVGRRPSVLRQVLPLTTATVVLLFAVGSFFLAASNRSVIAHVEVGSARVVDVTPPPGLNFEAAVRRADPTGHEAMAAAYYSSSTGTLLAVDSSRLASVASWPASLSSTPIAVLAKKLSPSVPSGVNFTGNTLRLTLDVEQGSPAMELGVNFFDEDYGDSEITNVAPVLAGLHSYNVALSGECGSGCRLTSLNPIWINPYAKYSHSVRIVLREVAVRQASSWHTVTFGAGQRGTWAAQPPPSRVATTTGACCGVVFNLPPHILGFGGVQLSPIDLPAALPAIVTNGSETFDPPTPPSGQISAEGLDGAPLTLQPVATVPTLPLIGQNGTLVDLGFAQRSILNPETYTTFQVWLTAKASPTILQRLRADGVTIGPTMRASTRLRDLNHGGIALAYTVALLVSPIAALLAIGTMTFVIVSDGRRRRNEITSMSMTGVPTRTMRRALLYENAMVLGVALVVGTIVGFIADSLALSSLPEFSAGSGGVPLATAVPITPFFCAVGALALLLAGAVELATRSILRGARSRRDHGSSI